MTHLTPLSCICVLAVFGVPPREAGTAEVFLSPQCEASAGFDSNRYRTEQAVGSSFLAFKPGLELNIFMAEAVDISGFAFYQRNEFLGEESTSSETSGGMMGIRHVRGAWETGISFSGFAYRDAELPSSDLNHVSCSPEVVYTHINGIRYSLAAFIGEYQYQSTEPTVNETVNGFSWALRPRVHWTVSFPFSLWVEGFVQGGSSDDSSDEYDGSGVTVGLDYSPSGSLSAASVVQYGAYHPGDNTVSRQDTFSATLSLVYRANTWAEVHGDIGGGTYWSRDSGFKYDQWHVSIGLRLVHDFEIGSPSI